MRCATPTSPSSAAPAPRGVRGLAWWEGDGQRGAASSTATASTAAARSPAYAWAEPQPAAGRGRRGRRLPAGPLAVGGAHLRFDEALCVGHGFDLDFCLQARAAGRKVVAADLRVIHHRSLELRRRPRRVGRRPRRARAEKWDAGRRTTRTAGRPRARRAEAEREAARAVAYSSAPRVATRASPALERELEAATGDPLLARSRAPLRGANRLRAAPRAAARG